MNQEQIRFVIQAECDEWEKVAAEHPRDKDAKVALSTVRTALLNVEKRLLAIVRDETPT